jgi:chromosome segregation ATPase
MKYTIEGQLRDLGKDFEALQKQMADDFKKRRTKITAEELTARQTDIRNLQQEMMNVQRAAKGHPRIDAEGAGGAGMGGSADEALGTRFRTDDLMSGKLKPTRVVQEDMSAAQEMKLAQVQAEFKAQDDILDQLSSALDQLKETTLAINDELDLQETMLKDTEAKVDAAQSQLDKVNERLKHALELANEKSTQFCAYFICLAILLGLLTILFNLVQKK